MVIRILFVAIFCCCQIVYVSGSFAQAPLTAEELINTTVLKKHIKSLESGEIVIIGRPENEIDTEMDVAMSVLIPAPLNKTVDVLHSQSSGNWPAYSIKYLTVPQNRTR